MNLYVLAFLIGMAATLMAVGSSLAAIAVLTRPPLEESPTLARASVWVASSAALPVLVLLVTGMLA